MGRVIRPPVGTAALQLHAALGPSLRAWRTISASNHSNAQCGRLWRGRGPVDPDRRRLVVKGLADVICPGSGLPPSGDRLPREASDGRGHGPRRQVVDGQAELAPGPIRLEEDLDLWLPEDFRGQAVSEEEIDRNVPVDSPTAHRQ